MSAGIARTLAQKGGSMTDKAPPGVITRRVKLATYDGQTIDAHVTEPDRPGPWPGIVFGQEAMGFNEFGRSVAERAAAAGYVTITPDYYRGGGPSRPDDYSDFTEVMTAIGELDFVAATHDVMAGADWLRTHPQVDHSRIVAWGYCTGGTLAMLATALDRRLAAAVWFFPSQPVFEALTPKRPTHPMDLMWNIACPVLVIYGEADPIMPPELLAELRKRLEQWRVEHEVKLYPGASHAFAAPAPHMHHAEAAAASWQDAMSFLERRLAEAADR
jgi:carboxymethylenebutenolidase